MTKLLKLKKIISYLVDIQLDKASTAINPVLDLSLRNGRFYLTTTNAVYSYGDLYDNFLNAFKRIDFSRKPFNSILVLGFGMGSVPYMLEHVFHQKFSCVGVEADAKIVGWAKQYALPQLSNPVELVQADAEAYVGAINERFDLVVVDIFLDEVVPEKFSNSNFLRQVQKLMKVGGVLLYNRLSDTAPSLAASQVFYENHFKSMFPNAEYLEVGGNWILANEPVFMK